MSVAKMLLTPMPGARATGRLALRPTASVPRSEATMVATIRAPRSMPVAARIVGFKTTM